MNATEWGPYMSYACRLTKTEGPPCTADCIIDGVICPLYGANAEDRR